jgi:hypothetical protein
MIQMDTPQSGLLSVTHRIPTHAPRPRPQHCRCPRYLPHKIRVGLGYGTHETLTPHGGHTISVGTAPIIRPLAIPLVAMQELP